MCIGSKPKAPEIGAPPPPPPADAPKSPALNETTSAATNDSDLVTSKRKGKSSLLIPLNASAGSSLGIPS